MAFFTGIGNHERAFNSTFFALYDFSKISKYFNSNASFYLCLLPFRALRLGKKDNIDQSGKFTAIAYFGYIIIGRFSSDCRK